MSDATQPVRAALTVDRAPSTGNSPGADGRYRLHTKVANDISEPIPVVVTGAGGGTSEVDQDTFVYGTNEYTPVGGVYQDTNPDLAQGQGGSVRLNEKRAMHISVRDEQGDPLGTTGNPFGVSQVGSWSAIVDIIGVGGFPLTLGQKLMAASVPVAIASDQSPVPVSQSGAWTVKAQLQDNAGTAITLGQKPMATSVPVTIASDQTPVPVSGTVTANQGGAPWSQNLTQVGGAALTLGQKVMAESVPVVLPSNQTITAVATVGNPTVNTYAAVATFTIAANSTDIFTITGSGSRTVRIRKLTIGAINTANTNILVGIIKRSTANSGGTSSTITSVPYDSTNLSATSVVRNYTANPTLGTAVGHVASRYIFAAVLTSSNESTENLQIFGDSAIQPIILRGTSEVLSVNLGGVAISGTTVVTIKVEFTEE